MKEEPGRGHFAGCSWRGFRHHAALVMLAFGFLALEQRRARTPAAAENKSAVAPDLITLPAIRCGLQQLLAPIAKPDCPCGRLHLLSNQLTE